MENDPKVVHWLRIRINVAFGYAKPTLGGMIFQLSLLLLPRYTKYDMFL
jgi:hypothetical protein